MKNATFKKVVSAVILTITAFFTTITPAFADTFTPNTTGLTQPFQYYFEAGTTGNVDFVEGENFHKYNDYTYVYKFDRKGSIATNVKMYIPNLSGTNIQMQPYIIVAYRHDLNYALAYYVNGNTFEYTFPTAGKEFTFYQIYYNPEDYDGVFWYLTDRWLTEIPELTRQNRFISLNYVYHITDENMPGYTIYNKYDGNLRLPMPLYIDWHNTRGPLNTATSKFAGSFTYKTGNNTQYSIPTTTEKDGFYYGFASSSDSTTQTPYIITFPSLNYSELNEYHFSRLKDGTTAPFSLQQYTEVESDNPPPTDGNIGTDIPDILPPGFEDNKTELGTSTDDLNEKIDQIDQLEDEYLDDFNNSIDGLIDFSPSTQLLEASMWLSTQMQTLFNNMGDFQLIITLPLVFGLAFKILHII